MGTEMTPELDAKLVSWLADRAPSSMPPEFVDRILAIPKTVPVDGRRGLRVIDGGRRRMLLLVAAALVGSAAIGGGLFIAGMQQHVSIPPVVRATAPPVEAPSVAPPSSSAQVDVPVSGNVIPAAIPAGIANGSIDTPIGRARWVHWQTDGTSLPDPVPQVLPDGRYLWFTDVRSGTVCTPESTDLRCTDPTPTLSVSDGLLDTRRPIPLPTTDPDASVFVTGDRTWYRSVHPAGLWWSDALGPWQTADETAIRSPGPDIPWSVGFGFPVMIAGRPATWVRFDATDPGALLGHPGEPVSLVRDDHGGYLARLNRFRSQGGPKDLGKITVSETDGGIRFLDEHGREVGRVDGVDMSFVDAWVRHNAIAEQQLYVLVDERWTPVDLALGRNAGTGILDATPDGAVAIASDATGHVRLFRSTDGIVWSGGEALVAADGTPLVSDDLWVDDTDGHKTYIVNRDGSERWASTDLQTWTLGPFPEGMSGTKTAGGWIRMTDEEGTPGWAVSRDRVTWEPAPELATAAPKLAPDGAGGTSMSNIGDAVWYEVEEADAPYTRDIWVIEFDG